MLQEDYFSVRDGALVLGGMLKATSLAFRCRTLERLQFGRTLNAAAPRSRRRSNRRRLAAATWRPHRSRWPPGRPRHLHHRRNHLPRPG